MPKVEMQAIHNWFVSNEFVVLRDNLGYSFDLKIEKLC